jgi:hypothetical protein
MEWSPRDEPCHSRERASVTQNLNLHAHTHRHTPTYLLVVLAGHDVVPPHGAQEVGILGQNGRVPREGPHGLPEVTLGRIVVALHPVQEESVVPEALRVVWLRRGAWLS